MTSVEQLRIAAGLPLRASADRRDPDDLRKGYGGLRRAALRILGPAYDRTDFDAMVRQELEYQGVQETPRNWVACGAEVLRQLRHRRQQEPDFEPESEE